MLTPGLYRSQLTPGSLIEYNRRVTYAGNVVRQAFWEQQRVALDNIRACGVLQHHGTIGPTDILDLCYDINVAKWFALNDWNRDTHRYAPKKFTRHDDENAMLDEGSYICTVVIRVLGGTREPLPIKSRGEEVRLLPWNLTPLWSTRPQAQRGFGVWGIGMGDADRFGAVLSVIERRYHPHGAENGWDQVGGPTLAIDGDTYGALDDSSRLQDLLFPPEEAWLSTALEVAKGGKT